jgi:DNA-binding NarL/FixJ family response regulator
MQLLKWTMSDLPATVARHSAMKILNHVLIADDSAAIRRGLRREFEQAGWVVCGEAANGREAIEKAEQLHPQVILLDLAMPGMNGLTTARLLKQTLPEVHLILFTGHGNLFTSDEAHSAGLSAVFSKSEPITEMLNKAKSLVSHYSCDI